MINAHFAFKSKTMVGGLVLTTCFSFFLAGCDPAGTITRSLKPEVPQENLLTVDSWLGERTYGARISDQRILLAVEGYVDREGRGTGYVFEIKNTREHAIKLARANLSMKEGEKTFSSVSGKVIFYGNWTEGIEEITIPSTSTAHASIIFLEALCPRQPVVLIIDAFEDVQTREKIPFVIRFSLPKPFAPRQAYRSICP